MPDSASILRYLDAALGPLARAHGGECAIAADEEDAVAMLALAPKNWRLVVQYAGRGEQESAQVPEAPWRMALWVQATRGMAAQAGADVHVSRPAGAPPMLDLADAVEAWILALDFSPVPGVLGPARLGGSEWISLEKTRARQLRILAELPVATPAFPRYTPPPAP